jgi:hypothetical protein
MREYWIGGTRNYYLTVFLYIYNPMACRRLTYQYFSFLEVIHRKSVPALKKNRRNGDHQASGSVSFQEYSLLNGIWIVTAEGSGTVYKNEIKVPYYTLYGLLGIFTGTIKEDGLTIKGTALDNASGIKTPLLLQKE